MQVQFGFDFVQFVINVVFWFIFGCDGGFQQWLQDQVVGQQYVVFDFGFGQYLVIGVYVQCC